jgi:hypothetical protein
MKAKDMLRWVAALAFGGFGIYQLVGLVPIVAKWNGSWFSLCSGAFSILSLVVVPLMLGYVTFRRRYHELCSVLAMLGAIAAWSVLMDLPRRLHWYEFISGPLMDTPLMIFPNLGLSLLFLFGPFYAAASFYRFCMRLAARYFPTEACRSWPASAPDEESSRRED